MPVKYAFQGVEGTWFLQIEARSLIACNRTSMPRFIDDKVDHSSGSSGVTNILEPKNCLRSIDKVDIKNTVKKPRKRKLDCHKPSVKKLVCASKEKKKRKREREDCFFNHEASRNEMIRLGANEVTEMLSANKSPDCHSLASEFNHREHASRPMIEASSNMSTDVKSVSSIIRRYFPDHKGESGFASPTNSDLTSRVVENRKKDHLKSKTDENCLTTQVDYFPQIAAKPKRPPRLMHFPLPKRPANRIVKDKPKRRKIGKRLVMASCNLGLSPGKQNSAFYLSSSLRDEKVMDDSSSLHRRSVFEISDSSD